MNRIPIIRPRAQPIPSFHQGVNLSLRYRGLLIIQVDTLSERRGRTSVCCDCNSPTDRLYHETLLAQRLEQPHNYSPELVGSNRLFWRHLLQRYEGGEG